MVTCWGSRGYCRFLKWPGCCMQRHTRCPHVVSSAPYKATGFIPNSTLSCYKHYWNIYLGTRIQSICLSVPTLSVEMFSFLPFGFEYSLCCTAFWHYLIMQTFSILSVYTDKPKNRQTNNPPRIIELDRLCLKHIPTIWSLELILRTL